MLKALRDETGRAAAAASAAARATLDRKQENFKAFKEEGLLALRSGALTAMLASINGSLALALPIAREKIGDHLLCAAAEDKPLLTLLPRPLKKAERKRLEEEGTEPPA